VVIGIGVIAASNIPETLGVPALQTFAEANSLYENSGLCGFKKNRVGNKYAVENAVETTVEKTAKTGGSNLVFEHN